VHPQTVGSAGRSHAGAQPVGDPSGPADVVMVDQNSELVTAEPADQVPVARDQAQLLGNTAQDSITGRMTVLVVGLLEQVHINADQGDGLAGVDVELGVLQRLLPGEPVAEPGEGVAAGLVGGDRELVLQRRAQAGHLEQRAGGVPDLFADALAELSEPPGADRGVRREQEAADRRRQRHGEVGGNPHLGSQRLPQRDVPRVLDADRVDDVDEFTAQRIVQFGLIGGGGPPPVRHRELAAAGEHHCQLTGQRIRNGRGNVSNGLGKSVVQIGGQRLHDVQQLQLISQHLGRADRTDSLIGLPGELDKVGVRGRGEQGRIRDAAPHHDPVAVDRHHNRGTGIERPHDPDCIAGLDALHPGGEHSLGQPRIGVEVDLDDAGPALAAPVATEMGIAAARDPAKHQDVGGVVGRGQLGQAAQRWIRRSR
jgi:hypothetical protein